VHKRTSKYFCSKEGLSEDALVLAAEAAGNALSLTLPSSMLNLEKTGSKRCWFKVVPAQKNRAEGDKVGPDDKVFLLNVVAGLYLHQTKRLDEYGNYELDLYVSHVPGRTFLVVGLTDCLPSTATRSTMPLCGKCSTLMWVDRVIAPSFATVTAFASSTKIAVTCTEPAISPP
jgi:hypothetical protein